MVKASIELIESYKEWLSQYRWIWFGTLTFSGYPSLRKATRIFDKFINEIREKHGTRDFRWIRVTEHGADGNNLHFHVLIGGLHLQSGDRYMAMLRWQELAGESLITSFASHRNGIYYILKTLRPGVDFEIDFLLEPIAPTGAKAHIRKHG